MSAVLDLVRPDLKDFRAYSSARREAVDGQIWLNANECPWPPPGGNDLLNRYPDPQPPPLRAALADLYGVRANEVLVTRGSDEAMDLLCRGFCRAGLDSVLILPPTFGMYEVCARLQGARVERLALSAEDGFRVDADRVADVAGGARLVFLCSPNNPTGSVVDTGAVLSICRALTERALVVLDEAYVEFSARPGALASLNERPDNLVVLRTLSKAHALAAARVGALVGSPELVAWLERLLPPYPVPGPSVRLALAALATDRLHVTRQRIEAIRAERDRLARALDGLRVVRRVFPSQANFLLVACRDHAAALQACERRGVVVRDVSSHPGLDACLRITVGLPEENDRLLAALEEA